MAQNSVVMSTVSMKVVKGHKRMLVFLRQELEHWPQIIYIRSIDL